MGTKRMRDRGTTEKPIILKIGGSQAEDVAFLEALGPTVGRLDAPVVIVHGGGKEIASLQQALGLAPRFVEGLRVTDDAALTVVEMVLSGRVNKRIVARLIVAGVNALGVSGVDLGLVRVERLSHPAGDLGWVGHVRQVNADVLQMLLREQIIPVISPVSLGWDGQTYNVNADHAATAVAKALDAAALYFVTDVAGVLVDGSVVTRLSTAQAAAWIDAGIIRDGMLPKVRSALDAVAGGVREARICNLDSLTSDGGTRVLAE
jgi:acetylglutamate kinase